jgi:hypothetical protein
MSKLQFRVLYREFLFRVVDLELLSPQGDIVKLLGQFAGVLIFFSLMLALGILLGAGNQMQPELGLMLAWVEEHFLISTTMLVVGLFAVLSWESAFPDRRDVLVLAPLPVQARTLFLAKVAGVGTALGRGGCLESFHGSGRAVGVRFGSGRSSAGLRSRDGSRRCRRDAGGTGSRSHPGADSVRRRARTRNQGGRFHWNLAARREEGPDVWNGEAGLDLRNRVDQQNVYGSAAGKDGSARKGKA